ncbi:MAG: exo-alpha-sialidase [Anaerolineae bacterium]
MLEPCAGAYRPALVSYVPPPRVTALGGIEVFSSRRWIGCVRAADGTLYLPGFLASCDGGLTWHSHTNPFIDQLPMLVKPEGALLAHPEFSLVLDGWIRQDAEHPYYVRIWRVGDDLSPLSERPAPVSGLELRRAADGSLLPACFTREVVQLPDGLLLAPAYASLTEDDLPPGDLHSRLETAVKARTILLASNDEGASWRYHSTVAVARPGDPVGEGFNEPAMLHLADGRLLCILRTGHYTPLYACWSSDNGLTWSEPLYTGLERGCLPCLRQLQDGCLALVYGERFPAGWSRITPAGDWPRYEPILPGVGRVHLAISTDGGTTWLDQVIARNMGSCYTTFYEVEPGVLFFQCDGYYWRMQLHMW